MIHNTYRYLNWRPRRKMNPDMTHLILVDNEGKILSMNGIIEFVEDNLSLGATRIWKLMEKEINYRERKVFGLFAVKSILKQNEAGKSLYREY